jgi:hypothetical protein
MMMGLRIYRHLYGFPCVRTDFVVPEEPQWPMWMAGEGLNLLCVRAFPVKRVVYVVWYLCVDSPNWLCAYFVCVFDRGGHG